MGGKESGGRKNDSRDRGRIERERRASPIVGHKAQGQRMEGREVERVEKAFPRFGDFRCSAPCLYLLPPARTGIDKSTKPRSVLSIHCLYVCLFATVTLIFRECLVPSFICHGYFP